VGQRSTTNESKFNCRNQFRWYDEAANDEAANDGEIDVWFKSNAKCGEAANNGDIDVWSKSNAKCGEAASNGDIDVWSKLNAKCGEAANNIYSLLGQESDKQQKYSRNIAVSSATYTSTLPIQISSGCQVSVVKSCVLVSCANPFRQS
jgi:hypothetical protein